MHAGIKSKLRSRLKVPQVDAMLRIKQLCGSYVDFDYQPAIDMLDSNTVGSGLLAKLAQEVSNVQAPFIADSDNEEEDGLNHADDHSQATLCQCVLSAVTKKKCSSRQERPKALSRGLFALLKLTTLTI